MSRQIATLCFRDYKGRDLISAITQKQKEGSHINLVGANDFAGRNATDRVDMLAPCDMIVRAIANGDNTVFFESVDEVQTPTGISKIWMMCTHIFDADLNALDIHIGKTFRQGEPLYTEGAKGIGSGYHIHCEVGKGVYNGKGSPYYKSSDTFKIGDKVYAQYYPCTNGKELPIEDVMYLADVEIVPRVSTGKTILDLYPGMKFVPTDDVQDLKNKVAELELQLETERKMRQVCEDAIKQRDDIIERIKEVLK